jgi:hypothetical protein
LDGAPDGDGDLPEAIFANEICGTGRRLVMACRSSAFPETQMTGMEGQFSRAA